MLDILILVTYPHFPAHEKNVQERENAAMKMQELINEYYDASDVRNVHPPSNIGHNKTIGQVSEPISVGRFY